MCRRFDPGLGHHSISEIGELSDFFFFIFCGFSNFARDFALIKNPRVRRTPKERPNWADSALKVLSGSHLDSRRNIERNGDFRVLSANSLLPKNCFGQPESSFGEKVCKEAHGRIYVRRREDCSLAPAGVNEFLLGDLPEEIGGVSDKDECVSKNRPTDHLEP